MKRLIATDYDGTFRRGGVIDPEDVRKIERWREAGNYFGFATGRGLDFVSNFKERELHDAGATADFLILYNGALITDIVGNTLYETFLHRDTCLELQDYFSKQEKMQSFSPVGDAEWQHAYYATSDSPETALKYAEEIKRLMGDKVNPVVNYWHINCMARGTCKASGVAQALKLFGLKPEEAAVVGDDWNDLDMILEFDGWVVDSAAQVILDRAPHTTKSVGDLALTLLSEQEGRN